MHRIDNQYAVGVIPAPGAAGPQPDSYFILNTKVTQAWINAVQEEMAFLIESAGLTLVKGDLTQIKAAVQQLITDASGASGLTAIVEDTDPHLGGDLDVVIFKITSSSNGDVVLTANGTGKVRFNADDVAVLEYIRHRGDTNNYIRFPSTALISLVTNSVSRLDLSSAGLRLGAANSRITTILDDDTQSADSATALITQQSAKAYAVNELAANPVVNSQVLHTSYNIGLGTAAGTKTGWGEYGQGGATITQYTAQHAATISKFYVRGGWVSGETSIPLAATIIVTLQKNGVDTALAITLGRNTTTGSDTSTTVSVSAGDVLRLKIVTSLTCSNSNSGSRVIYCSFKFST